MDHDEDEAPVDLERINDGDPGALRALLEASWTPLVRFARRFVPTDDAAQDVAQEAFVRLWAHRERWSGGSARAVLFRIARNVALDERRRAEVRARAGVDGRAPAAGSVPTPDDALREADTRARAAAAIASLPDRRREVFELVRWEGLGYREVAEVLGLSVQTVANHMSLALRDLRTLLADVLPDVADGATDGERRSNDG